MSRPLRPSERRSAVVLVGAAGLAILAALEPLGGTAVPPAAPALRLPAPAADWQSGAAAAASPFDPARGPVAGIGRLPSLAAAAPPMAAPPIRLDGILVEGGRRRAMFSGYGVWQAPGSRVGEWTLEAVEPRAVRLRRGDEVMELRSDDALR